MKKLLVTIILAILIMTLFLGNAMVFADDTDQNISDLVILRPISHDTSRISAMEETWPPVIDTSVSWKSEDEGVVFYSTSSRYTNKSSLIAAYNELKKSLVGDEFDRLTYIHFTDVEHTDGGNILGMFECSFDEVSFEIFDSIITIYQVDSRPIDEVNHTLVHEYGHHFTFQYYWQYVGDWSKTKYGAYRGLDDFTPSGLKSEEYYNDSAEIATDDYILNFGSNDSRIQQGRNGYYDLYSQRCNEIGFSSDMDGLREYMYSQYKGLDTMPTAPSSFEASLVSVTPNGNLKTIEISYDNAEDSGDSDLEYRLAVNGNGETAFGNDLLTNYAVSSDSLERDNLIFTTNSNDNIYLYVVAINDDKIFSRSNVITVDLAALEEQQSKLLKVFKYLSPKGVMSVSFNDTLARLDDFSQIKVYSLLGREVSVSRMIIQDEELLYWVTNPLERSDTNKIVIPNNALRGVSHVLSPNTTTHKLINVITSNGSVQEVDGEFIVKAFPPIILTPIFNHDTGFTMKQNGVVVNNPLTDITSDVEIKTDNGDVFNVHLVEYSLSGDKVIRLAGINRIGTANKIGDEGWGSYSEYEIITNANNYPDALAGVPLSAIYDAPILLTGKESLNEATKNSIRANNIFILGGTGAISQAVEDELIAMGKSVERIEGSTRYNTAIAIGDKVMEVSNSKEAVIVTGNNYPDSLSISSFAANKHMPIVFSRDTGLDINTLAALIRWGITDVYIIGGISAVPPNVEEQLKAINIGHERIWGPNRYATSMAVVNRFLPNGAKRITVATGESFPDALSGGALAAKYQMPIILVGKYSISTEAEGYINSSDPEYIYVLGGTGAIDQSVVDRIK